MFLMEVRQNLIQLCEKINDGHYKITPDCAEYRVFEKWITDDQITILLAIDGTMKINTLGAIAKRAGMTKEKARGLLHELTEIGLLVQVVVPKVDFELYLQPLYTPGVFEFLLLNEKFCRAHPEIAYAFEQHATTSQIEHAMNTPMGAGIMRVIPVESAIPATAEQIDNERVSKYIESNANHLCALPCQCRRVRKLMGEGSGDMDENFCLFMGHVADMFIRLGRGKKLSKEEAYEMIKHVEEIGCVHQITTIENGQTFAICNCQPESCLALGVSQYYNTPATSQSNYVAEIDPEKCVACGQCTTTCANNAIKMGQKLCTKDGPVQYPRQELPDDEEWGPDKWNTDYRSNREFVEDSGTAPCKTACPAHIAVQGYIKLAAQGRYTDALELIKKENPFPAVCGRICNRRCEDECTRGRIDNAVAVDEVKKFIADKELDKASRFVPKKLHDYGKKIAVIGAGPAGMSCAYYLAADGYNVTVFDKNAMPGGMLRYGIPSFRLEKDVLDAEIEVLKDLGVTFRCGVEVGRDVTIQGLRDQGFEAFYLGIGAQKAAPLGIPGEDLQGVFGGIDFLRDVNAGRKPELGKKVVVVGGGNVAMDVARAAVRLGVKVTVAYRRKESDMRADPAEVAEAREEGIEFLFEHKPKEIKGKDGKVTALECEAGTIKCDSVIAAIGQVIDWSGLDVGGLKTGDKGRAEADGFTYQTAQPDIFVGGDVYTGPKFAIDAIAAGKQGAISIHRFVEEGQSLTIGRDRLDYKALDKDNLDYDSIKYNYGRAPRQVPVKAAKAPDFRDDRQTFTEEQLKRETSRCLGCGASVVDPNKCLGCGVCTTRCKFDAIHLKKRTNVESIPYKTRAKVLPEFVSQRERKIEIKKMHKS
jgi:NADPH-dependent glutamate synthase beta subunit-like oxidoreductase/NAD-dependent dihydropyrimidine dehydrogenase PreA subunit